MIKCSYHFSNSPDSSRPPRYEKPLSKKSQSSCTEQSPKKDLYRCQSTSYCTLNQPLDSLDRGQVQQKHAGRALRSEKTGLVPSENLKNEIYPPKKHNPAGNPRKTTQPTATPLIHSTGPLSSALRLHTVQSSHVTGNLPPFY